MKSASFYLASVIIAYFFHFEFPQFPHSFFWIFLWHFYNFIYNETRSWQTPRSWSNGIGIGLGTRVSSMNFSDSSNFSQSTNNKNCAQQCFDVNKMKYCGWNRKNINTVPPKTLAFREWDGALKREGIIYSNSD